MIIRTFLALAFALLVIPAHAETPDSSQSLEDRRMQKLEDTVMNSNLPLEKRIRALRKILADEMVGGRIHRTFCLWDPLGKAGPVASTADDQKLRSLHYGMELDFIIYQNEQDLLNDFKEGQKCDAALVRGHQAIQFNRFAGTIEAVGAVKDRKQLQVLVQLMANPKLAPKLTDPEYTVLGVVSVGENYVFTNNRNLRDVVELRGTRVGVEAQYPEYAELISRLGGIPVPGTMLENVQKFSQGDLASMISPAAGYLVMRDGGNENAAGIMNTPLATSTVHLIGYTDRFPAGLAQILREDFLFKFDSYTNRLDREMSIIPQSMWLASDAQKVQRLENTMLDVRLKLRDDGYYDPSMLTLQRKIRCKFDPSRDECRNPKE